MGCRLHSAKIYKVEYGTTEVLNWELEAFELMVGDLVDTDDVWSDGDDYCVAKHYEIDKEAFVKMIDAVRNATDEQFAEWGYKDADKEYVADGLQSLYDEADENNTYVRLAWI